jgi:hypothetical protein
MMLRHLMLEVTDDCANIRQTYSTRTAEEVETILVQIFAGLEDMIMMYVKQQDYPKHNHEVYKPRMLNRLPEYIRQRIVAQVDNALGEEELLLKFDLYMILCTSVGNTIQDEYSAQFQKVRKRLAIVAGKDINPKNN